MQFLKKHADSISVIAFVCAGVIYLTTALERINEKLWSMESRFNERFSKIDHEIADLKTDMAVVKTVLIMKDMMPKELAKGE
jgi:hypothetical protein